MIELNPEMARAMLKTVTELDLARILGIENEAEIGYSDSFCIDPRIIRYCLEQSETITHLREQIDALQRENYVVVDDDDDIEVIVDDDEPNGISYSQITNCRYRGFVERWRKEHNETANVIPISIHPKIIESDQRYIDEVFSQLGAESA